MKLGIAILIFAFAINIIMNFVWGWSPALDDQYPWFDVALHFLGGLGVYLVIQPYFSKSLSRAPSWQHALLIIGVTMLVGVLWEFAENLGTYVMRYHGSNLSLSGDLPDTLADLVMDLLGGIVGSTSHLFRRKG